MTLHMSDDPALGLVAANAAHPLMYAYLLALQTVCLD